MTESGDSRNPYSPLDEALTGMGKWPGLQLPKSELLQDVYLGTDLPLPVTQIPPRRRTRDETDRPKLFLNIRSEPDYGKLHSFGQFSALMAEDVLNLGESFEYLDLSTVKKIVDFGAGDGGPTYTLTKLAERTGGEVDAVESNENLSQEIVRAGILSAERVHAADGIDYLKERGRRDEKVDLITAFMLGPDTKGSLAHALVDAARASLSPGGHLLIASDADTISAARTAMETQGIAYSYMAGLPDQERPVPGTLIVSFPEQ